MKNNKHVRKHYHYTSDFVWKVIYFAMPFFLIVISVIIWDPFKEYFNYEEYYIGNLNAVNRQDYCLEMFLKHYPTVKYNSFIIGDSKSQAFKASEWEKFFDKNQNVRACHFDGGYAGVCDFVGIARFLDHRVDSIKNILLILSPDCLFETQLHEDFIYSQPPLISGGSALDYYSGFFKGSLNLGLILCNLDYSITHRYKQYMVGFINNPKDTTFAKNETGDIYYSADKIIKDDSLNYYHQNIITGSFGRDLHHSEYTRPAPLISLTRLKAIAEICRKRNTNIKVVIPPTYDQIKLDRYTLLSVKNIFGQQNVYDYTGSNSITNEIGNYYELSHFRPNVAKIIMNDIYMKNNEGPKP